jgi:GntR family transcriptional regulator/MocR family aminotransferase
MRLHLTLETCFIAMRDSDDGGRCMAADDTLWRQLFGLSRASGHSLQVQLRAAVVQAILDRRLLPGTILPSSRHLADLLGVSRNTVTLAYALLTQEGFVVAHDRARHRVGFNAHEISIRTDKIQRSSRGESPDWDALLLRRPSRDRIVPKPPDWHSHRFPFVYGQPDAALFPMAEWREVAQMAVRPTTTRDWSGDRGDADDPMLVEQIVKRVLPRRGIFVSPEQVLITIGAQQALYLVMSLLLRPDMAVGIEQPGYPDIRNMCRHFGARMVGLPMDQYGLRLGRRVEDCDMVFVQPSHQNPTTVTMPLRRRIELLDAAAKHDFLIIEDYYEGELTFGGEATAALRALENNDRVIYVGSLSKTIAPGLRIGYLVGPPAVIDEARALRRLIVRHPPGNNQRTAALFLHLGYHDVMIKRLIAAYRDRAAAIGEALRNHLPRIAFRPPVGGSALWAKGPASSSMDRVARQAAADGILLDPGSLFFDAPVVPENFVRFGYSAIPLDRIEPGIRALAPIVRAEIANQG